MSLKLQTSFKYSNLLNDDYLIKSFDEIINCKKEINKI